MVLPVLVSLAIGLVWFLSLASQQVRVVDAAREAARVAARGDPDGVAIERARTAAPGSTVEVVHDGGEVTVTVSATAGGPGGLFRHLPGAHLSARAVAAEEAP